jgi:uncharacterized tellurite resistance protein B-like protein
MLDRVLQLLTGNAARPAVASDDNLQVAVAALLIEAARMDDQFDGAERRTIEHLLAEGFDLPQDAVHDLIVSAERAVRQSTQFFPFTQQINKQIAHEDRARILEMMWEVVYADGVLDPQEDMLLLRIAGLIHISDQDRGLARQRALAKLAAKKDA